MDEEYRCTNTFLKDIVIWRCWHFITEWSIQQTNWTVCLWEPGLLITYQRNIDIIHVVAGNGQVLQIDPFVTVLVLAFLRLCLVNVWRNLEQNENLNETKLPNYTLPLNVYIPTVVPRVAASSRRGGYQSVQKSIRGHISLSGSCIVFSMCCHRHFFVPSIWILLGILFQCCV